MNNKILTTLKNSKINSTNGLLIILSIICTIFFYLHQFLVIWDSGDGVTRAKQNGVSYVEGMIYYKGWGPYSVTELGGAHPISMICLFIPVIILALLLMKKTSEQTYKCMAVMVFVDFMEWQIMRSKAAWLAHNYNLDFEITPLFVFNMIFIICMFVIIVAELIKNTNLKTIIANAMMLLNKAKNNQKMVYRYCDNCGNELESSHVFCPSCGKKIEWDF